MHRAAHHNRELGRLSSKVKVQLAAPAVDARAALRTRPAAPAANIEPDPGIASKHKVADATA